LKKVQRDAPKSSRKFDFHLLLNKLKYFTNSEIMKESIIVITLVLPNSSCKF